MISNDVTLKAYNLGVKTYIDATNHNVDGIVADWLDQSVAGLPKDALILEIGSAFGRDAAYIEAKGYRVQRTDASEGFVMYLQEHGKPASLLNVLKDSIPLEEYDFIFASAVFLHFTEPEFISALKNVYDGLKPGGRFALSLKKGTGEEVTTQKMNAPRYFHYWEPADIAAFVERVGFTDFTFQVSEDSRDGKPQWIHAIARKAAA